MNNPVFCSKCKHFNRYFERTNMSMYCNHPSNLKKTHHHDFEDEYFTTRRIDCPSRLNKNNDCPKFEQNDPWWKFW